jgi:hypothetical protein
VTPEDASVAAKAGTKAEFMVGRLWLLLPATIVVAIFFVLPVALTVPKSVFRDGSVNFDAYAAVLGDGYYGLVLWRSLWLSFVSTVVCVLLGYPIAYYATRLSARRYKRYIYMIILAPLFTTAVHACHRVDDDSRQPRHHQHAADAVGVDRGAGADALHRHGHHDRAGVHDGPVFGTDHRFGPRESRRQARGGCTGPGKPRRGKHFCASRFH